MLISNKHADQSANNSVLTKALFCIFSLVIIAQFFMALYFEVNWDEFFMLDYLYQFMRGDLTNPLQTIYLHGMEWATQISPNEVTQIIPLRMLSLAALLGTVILLYKMSRRYFSIDATLLAIIMFLTFSYIFRHATSFRVDGLVTFVLIGAVYLLSTNKPTPKTSVGAGLLIGLAGILTIKAIFYVPTIAVILLGRWAYSNWSRREFINGVLVFIASIASFAGLCTLNKLSLGGVETGLEYLGDSGNSGVIKAGLFPQWNIFAYSLLQNFIYWVFFIFGLIALFIKFKNERQFRQNVVSILALTLPMLTLIFYKNTFHYFYLFMLAPSTVIIAAGYDKMREHLSHTIIIILIIAQTVSFLQSSIRGMSQNLNYQKQVVQAVHDLFPERDAYIDGVQMISAYDKKGLFVMPTPMRKYYGIGQPIMEDILRKDQPKFVLANRGSLDLDHLDDDNRIAQSLPLLPDDTKVLQENYIQHWGLIYVPGKRLSGTQTSFEILIGGDYTVETTSSATINGTLVKNGDVINLQPGIHSYIASEKLDTVLRWGDHLPIPNTPVRDHALFRGF